LQGEEDAAGCSAAELGDELEATQKLADLGERGGGPIAVHQALAVEKELELGPPAGEPIDNVGRNDFQARFMAEANFFMNQSQGRLGTEVGMAVEKCLGSRALATLPCRDHFVHELRCQRGPAAIRDLAGRGANGGLSPIDGRKPGRICWQLVKARGHIMSHLL
jgi:hypothetical protein